MHGLDQNACKLLLLGLLQVSIPSIPLVATPKGSILRYAPFPFMIWVVGQFAHIQLGPSFLTACLVIHMVVATIVAARILVICPLDGDDIDRDFALKQSNCFARLYNATWLVLFPRGLNTASQISKVPPYPAYYTRRGMKIPPRGRFLIRQLAILIWQYLFLDILNTLAIQKIMEQNDAPRISEPGVLGIDWIELVENINNNNIGWFFIARTQIDFYNRFLVFVLVGLGLSSPHDCRPLYGRMADAYTLRNYWGKFWHQLMRQPLTTVGCFVARDILRLPRPSVWERYTNTFFVFFTSGVIHLVLDMSSRVPSSGAMPFFCIQTLGIMLEDGVQALWRRLHGAAKGRNSPFWQRVIGHIWVLVWFGITSVWYFGQMSQAPELASIVPFDFQSHIPVSILGGILLVGGVMLKLVFEVEV